MNIREQIVKIPYTRLFSLILCGLHCIIVVLVWEIIQKIARNDQNIDMGNE